MDNKQLDIDEQIEQGRERLEGAQNILDSLFADPLTRSLIELPDPPPIAGEVVN